MNRDIERLWDELLRLGKETNEWKQDPACMEAFADGKIAGYCDVMTFIMREFPYQYPGKDENRMKPTLDELLERQPTWKKECRVYRDPYQKKLWLSVRVGSRDEQGYIHKYFMTRYRKVGTEAWQLYLANAYEDRFTDVDIFDIPMDGATVGDVYEVHVWYCGELEKHQSDWLEFQIEQKQKGEAG